MEEKDKTPTAEEYEREMEQEESITMTRKEWSRLAVGFRFVGEAMGVFMNDPFAVSFIGEGMDRDTSEALIHEMDEVYTKAIDRINALTPEPPSHESIREHMKKIQEGLPENMTVKVIEILGDEDGEGKVSQMITDADNQHLMSGGREIPEA